MKKTFLFLLIVLFLMPATSVTAQNNKKGNKEISPFIEGRKKVRKTDYDSIWKFTTFDAKSKYFCPIDYDSLPTIIDNEMNEWGAFRPVINYLSKVSRSPMRICAIFAINPTIENEDERARLIEQARNDAYESLTEFKNWWVDEEERHNKFQLFVAQVDYRYWKGSEYFTTEQPSDDIIRVGLILYFGSKKIDLFPSSAEGAKTFNDVKFFPNDATIAESYNSYLDNLASYLKENDRLEVLLCGYSDNSGTDAYNKGLSRQRAVEIKKALVFRGIPDYRIEIEAHGSDNPIGDNNTYTGRIANNRVSVTIQ